ncbi:MAG: hypothetical protein KAS32_07830, partial [Candidatus Peribacteraceae bacterium]|nr:hypothetical protein [Candidatus Peribacteraceae bacterium]
MLKLNQNRHNPFNFCENRLIFKASRIEVLAQNTVDTIKENTPQTKDQLEKLLISIRVPDRAIFFSKFKEKVGSMNLIEIEAIETNLKSLETQITTGDIAQHIQSLKSVIDKQIETGKMAVQSNTTTATPNISNKPVLTKLWDATKQGAEKTRVAIISGAKSTGDFIENSTDAVLPKKWTLHMSRNQKIAIGIIGSAGTLIVGKWIYESGKKIGNGIGKLFGWGKESAEKGKEAAEKTKGGLFKKLLIGTGVGMAAFFGIDFLMKINGIKGMMDRMRNALTPKEKGESSEEEYGISNKEYNEAEQAYKVWNIKRIKEIFECNTGKETPEYLKFVGYMKNKYEVQIIDKLPYKKHEAAFEAYEDNMKSVFRIIKEKFEDRKYILAIGATIAWQTGILSILGETGITVANKSTELAKYLAKTTAKTAKNHPLIALLALGGGIATFYTIMKNNKNKNFLMPSNIPILIQALNIGTPFPYPSNQINIPKQLLADMKEYAASLS